MKKLILLTLMLVMYSLTFAQFKQVAEGPKFEEPEEGFAKILQLKNGNTFYIHVTLKDGINVRIYDANHIEKVVSTFSPAYVELEKSDDVEGVLEINNDVIVFVNKAEDHLLTLHRLIIDGSTGKLKKQKIIAVSKNVWKESAFINTRQLDFFNVRKDQYSDNYAIAIYDASEKDKTKRVEIIHFGSDNNEIIRKFCFLPSDTRCNFIDMVVINTEKVCAFLEFKWKDEIKNNVMAVIEKGKPEIDYTELNIPLELHIPFGISKYNPVTKKILLLVAGISNPNKFVVGMRSKSKNEEYTVLLNMIDPATKEIKPVPEFGPTEKLNAGYNEILDQKKGFKGMPQNIIINNDGSFTVLYEEIMFLGNGDSEGTNLGSLVVSTFDLTGKFVSEYLVVKDHLNFKHQLFPFYLSKRELSAQLLFKGNQYKSFSFIDGTKNKYILFNDTEKNNDITNTKLVLKSGTLSRSKLIRVSGITGDCDAFKYTLTGIDILPKRDYLFGERDKGHFLAAVTISSYNKTNNIYATLMLDKINTRNKMVSVVWQEPQ